MTRPAVRQAGGMQGVDLHRVAVPGVDLQVQVSGEGLIALLDHVDVGSAHVVGHDWDRRSRSSWRSRLRIG